MSLARICRATTQETTLGVQRTVMMAALAAPLFRLARLGSQRCKSRLGQEQTQERPVYGYECLVIGQMGDLQHLS